MATKGGGSLLGRADSTLAQMSYREAMADVGPDLKGVYSEEVKNQAAFEKGVQDHFDALYADNNALADELKTATTKAMEGLGTDYEAMELFNNELTSMKQRMKALPKDKKGDFERSKIRAEMNMLLNSSKGLDEDLTKIGTMIKAGEFNKHTTDYPVLLSIANGTAKKIIDNGKLMYSIPNPDGGEDLKIDRQGVKDALGQSDLEFEKDFVKLSSGQNAKGKQKGTTFDRQGSINAYEDLFPSEAALAANMNEKQGSLPYTFVQALTGKDGSDSIYKALMDMGQTTIDQYDANKDGKITNADFANKENGIELIKSLTEPRSKNYNYQAAKRAAAEFYTDNIDKKEFDDGVRLRTGGGGSGNDEELSAVDNWFESLGQGGRIGTTMSKGKVGNYYNASTIKDIYDDMLDGKLLFENNLYTNEDGVWFGEDLSVDGAEKQEIGNQETFVRNILNQRNDVWTKAEIKADIEEIDRKSGDKKTPIPENKELHTKIFDQIATADMDDDTAAEKLNNLFDLNKGTSKIKFMPYSGTVTATALRTGAGGTNLLSADAGYTDDLMLYNPRTGEIIRNKSGDRARFKTGKDITDLNEQGLSPEISQIIKILKEQNIKIPGSETDPTAINTSDY